jgi:hypothetical protein
VELINGPRRALTMVFLRCMFRLLLSLCMISRETFSVTTETTFTYIHKEP